MALRAAQELMQQAQAKLMEQLANLPREGGVDRSEIDALPRTRPTRKGRPAQNAIQQALLRLPRGAAVDRSEVDSL